MNTRQTFPVQYSVLSAEALGKHIAQHYGLTLTSCRLLIHGVSDTYLLEGLSGKFILKVYRDAHRKPDEIKGELELLNILAEKGAKVAAPLTGVAGSQVQEFQAPEGIRIGVLFPFAKGKVVPVMTPDQLQVLGREMAFNHQVTSAVTLSYPRKAYTMETMVNRPLTLLEPAFKDLPELFILLKETSDCIAAHIHSLDTPNFSTGYCHYDYFPKNFFFDEQDNLTLFDFDFAGHGLLVNDLASLFAHYTFDIAMKRLTEEEALAAFAAVIKSYRTVRPLSQAEEQAVPFFAYTLLLFYLGFQYENFEDWSNFFWGPRYLHDRVNHMQWIAEKFC